MSVQKQEWDWEFGANLSYRNADISALLAYRHLMVSLVKRDLLLNYQQTLLGPLWMLFQPILTLCIYVFVFGKLIGVSIGSIPPVLFYFSGIILWNLFNDSFVGTSRTFRDNIHLFSKVYFPRIIMPLALMGTQFLRFCIQLALLMIIIAYYAAFHDLTVRFGIFTVLIPVVVLCVGATSLGLGLIFSVITAKYRDLVNLIDVCIRLLIFITPVIYPLSSVRKDLSWIVQLNPLTPLFELFRLGLMGEGLVTSSGLLYSLTFTVLILITALLLFHKHGSKLIDFI